MRVLGIDCGERRVGLAISDPTATLARPLRTLLRTDSTRAVVSSVAREIAQLAAEPDGLSGVVVGLPVALDGTPHEQTQRTLQFVDALRKQVDLPIVLQDERLTSHEAEARLAETEPDWRQRKLRLDAAAAAVILQDYLDARRRTPLPSETEP